LIRAAVLAAVVLAASGCTRTAESDKGASSEGEPAPVTAPVETAHVTSAAPIDGTPVATDKIALQVIGMT
jgi:hypothetical protein